MARLLAYTSPSQGNLYPSVDMLLELADRGHEVHVRTRSAEVAAFTAAGLRAEPVDPHIEEIELDDYLARSQVDAMKRLIRFYATCAELEIPDLGAAIGEIAPDGLIVDVNCVGACALAESSGLPWAQFCPHPPPIRSEDVPAHGMGWAPGRGALGRLRDRMSIRLADRLVAPLLEPINAQRRPVGVPDLARWDDMYAPSDRFILFTAEPYEFPRTDWPANVRLVGPGLWEPPAEAPSWLAEEKRPIVLVTASTARQRDDRLITAALEALPREGFAVIATSAAHDPVDFDAPPGARVEASLPHGPIIQRAACVVSHGGQGTTQRSLANGVPVCVVPFSRDQFDVGRRVEIADAGVRLHHKRLNPSRLLDSVRETLTKRPGAERVASSFAGAGGAPAAAAAVEDMLTAQ